MGLPRLVAWPMWPARPRKPSPELNAQRCSDQDPPSFVSEAGLLRAPSSARLCLLLNHKPRARFALRSTPIAVLFILFLA